MDAFDRILTMSQDNHPDGMLGSISQYDIFGNSLQNLHGCDLNSLHGCVGELPQYQPFFFFVTQITFSGFNIKDVNILAANCCELRGETCEVVRVLFQIQTEQNGLTKLI